MKRKLWNPSAGYAVVIGRKVILNIGCDRLHSALRQQKNYEPIAMPPDEFVKACGSATLYTA